MLRRMPQNTITLVLKPAEAPELQALLKAQGFELDVAPHSFFRARGSGCTITFYKKGKVVLQGRYAENWAMQIAPDQPLPGEEPHPFDNAMKKHPVPAPKQWAGIDETGKGDYFGPLVVVAAAVERSRVELLRELGVADSKKLTDQRAKKLAMEIRTFCPFRKVVIHPERYNSLYARIGNLNQLLAWGHARALEDLLEIAPGCTYALSDQFARNRAVVERKLMTAARAIHFDQRTRAEEDPAVAAASILARAEFVWQMEKLERTAGQRLPKGAGPPVLSAAKELVSREGAEALQKYAKMHFKTTDQVLGTPPGKAT